MVLICPNLYSQTSRDDFNKLLERLGGRPLDLRAARNRNTYLDGLNQAERDAYAEAHQIWSRELGDPAAALAYVDSREMLHGRLKATGTTRATMPHDIPGEGAAHLTPAAQARRTEMREAIDRTAAQILPDAARVRLVERIHIADGRAEARALAYRLRKGEIKDVDFTTKHGKDYFAHFSARDDEGNLFVQVYPPDAVPAKPARGGEPEKPGTPSAAHIYLDYMGPADPAIHGFAGPRYEVGLIHTERGHRRLGIASALYDTIEKALSVKLVPSGWLLPDGYKFWQSRNSELLRGYAQEGDSWISPRQIKLGLDAERKNLIEAIADNKPEKIQKYKDSVAQYEQWWKQVPKDLKAQNKLDAMFALRPAEHDRQIVAALQELAKHDEIFARRKSDKRTLKGIFAEIVPEVRFVRSEKASGEAAGHGAERIHHFKTKDGKDFRVYDNRGEVWIDVSELKKGEIGSAVYAVVGNYAFNTGREFIGDPGGISDIALRRRTEQMLSSALKFGTTKHLRPHPEQVAGRPDLGIPPLRWTPEDEAANIAALVHVSVEALAHHAPEIRNARFDFATGTFRTGKGEPISDGMLDDLAGKNKRIRASGAGRASLKRNILQNTLLQEAGREGRLGLLDQILQLTSQLDQPGKSFKGAFYSVTSGVEALGRTDPYTMTISLAARAIEAEARARGVTAGEQTEKVLRHEGIEFFKALGLINGREWSVLENAARKEGWIDETGVREPYSELYHEGVMSREALEDILIKEAIAEKYSEFHLGRREFSGMIGQTFQRIKDFMTRAMNALRGMGFQKWEDVFGRIERGEFKQRFEQAFGNLRSPNTAQDQSLMLAGIRSQTADRGMRSLAERMEERGKKPDDIWKATGWLHGKDGKWRYEIDDSQAKITNLEKLTTPPTRGFLTSLLGQQPKATSDVKVVKNIPLPQLLQHPQLYTAYPFLRQMRVDLAYGKSLKAEGALRQRDDQGRTVYRPIRVIASSAKDVKTVLVHEIQHYIQNREDFARGSDTAGRRQRRDIMFASEGQSAGRPPVYDPAQRELPEHRQWRMGPLILDDTHLENVAERLLDQYDLERSGNAGARAEIANLETKLEEAMRLKPGTYGRSYGEWEARLVEERQNLTAEERRREFPLQDMPEDLEIGKWQTRNYQQAYDEIMRRAMINRAIKARWAERKEIGAGVSVVRDEEEYAAYFYGEATPPSADPLAQVSIHPDNMMATVDFHQDIGSASVRPSPEFYDLPYARQKAIMDAIYRDVRMRNMQPHLGRAWVPDEQFAFWSRYDPAQVVKDPRLYRDRLEAAVKVQYGDEAKLVLYGDVDPTTGETYEGAYEPFGVYMQKGSGKPSMIQTLRKFSNELDAERQGLDAGGQYAYEDQHSFELDLQHMSVNRILRRMEGGESFEAAADAEFSDAKTKAGSSPEASDRFYAVHKVVKEIKRRGETAGGLENIGLIADENGVIMPAEIRSEWDEARGSVEPGLWQQAQIDEALRERGIRGDQLLAVRRRPSPADEAFAAIRADLGLADPTPWKGSKRALPRQQLVHIAVSGSEPVLRLHGEAVAPFLAQYRAELERMALPLSTDRIGDGFKRLWRELILRPSDLRQTRAQMYTDFTDILDAEAPQLLESIDRMHMLGAEQLNERRAAAAAGGAGGRTPPGGGTPPLPPPGNGRWPAIFSRFVNGWKRGMQPELMSNSAFEADPLFAAYRAGSAQEKDMIVARGEELYEFWRKQPEAARLQFLKDVDAGARQPTPQLAEIAWRYKQLLDRAHRDEVAYGSRAAYIEDYMPRLFKKEKAAQQFFSAQVATLGPTWFQKHRHYDLLEEALAAGHELRTTNPEELVALRLMAGADMRQRMELLNALERMGLARRVKDLQRAGDLGEGMGANGGPPLDANDGFARAGWQAINAPTMEQWLISPDIQPLWKNAVESRGLWADPSAAGTVFRAWMTVKNAWVPIKLAVSFFHPLHVLHINFANDMTRAWSQATSGDLGGALRSFVDALTPTQGIGKDARHAWLKPVEERTPEERALVDLMVEGGFSPQLSEQLRIAARRNLQKALDDGWKQYWKVPFHGLRLAIEKAQAPIFERWIPGLKAAAYIKEAQALFERRPDLLDDATKRGVALRAIGKQVDNRFGEMFYSTLFWNRYTKDAAIGSFISLGWQTGFLREFGGAAIETGTRQFTPSFRAKEAMYAATNKRAYALTYIASAMLINGAMSWMLSGEPPDELMDYIFARVGGKNPDGSKRRITNMFYTREAPMLVKHMQEQGGGFGGAIRGARDMIWNKMMYQPFVELAENRDYWGYEIYDTNSPLVKQAMQVAGYMFTDQGAPISLAGAQRARDLSGSWWDKSVPLSVMGFGPAPAYAERSAMENRIRHLYQEFVAPLKKPYEAEAMNENKRRAIEELKLALQNGDMKAAHEARLKAEAAGAKPKYLTSSKLNVPTTYYLFSRLAQTAPDAARALLRQMSPSERNAYRKYAPQKLRREFPAVVNPDAMPAAQPEAAPVQ